jgi:DNA-binding NarL/FixJ family response regulator
MTGGMRLVLVEDHVALREGIGMLLSKRGYTIAGAVGDARSGYSLIPLLRPDVALVDVGLPDESGAELTRRLLDADPGLRVLLYTGIDEPEVLRDALDCGARGFALKAGPPEELVAAIETLAQGGTYMDPRLAPAFLERTTTTHVRELSPREREVLDLLAAGLTGAKAAQRLGVSSETVRTHVKNAMRKLDARTRIHAVTLALSQNAISLEPGPPRPVSEDGGVTTKAAR